MEGAIYRKTEKGKQEVADRALGLESHARRLLIIVDGRRDANELSVYVRAGEFEATLRKLLEEGYIEEIGAGEAEPGRVPRAPAANDPVVFAGIKIQAMTELRSRMRGRLASLGELLVEEINACHDPLELREKLRTLEDSLTRLLGAEDGVALARRIGAELTRLIP
ncbi:MAG TPA: hypothetical protein VJO54_12845 [Burkholderiales bacterium]|nr:hypothetical protein [Burkholderiales bacterium]